MPRRHYLLLWVSPRNNIENVPSLDQLDCTLQNLHARVMYGTSLERKALGQSAIRIFGAADENLVREKVEELHYTIVDEVVRLCEPF